MSNPPATRIYLDNAATSFPKPECVYAAMDRYHRELGCAVGRGAYRRSSETQAEVHRCRQRIVRLLNAERPESVIFTFNGTDSLNLAIHGLLQPGNHVVSSVIEHNSVIRPLREMERQGLISLSLVPANVFGIIDPDDVRRALKPSTRLIALTHASNVTGAIQPVAAVGKLARDCGVLFLIDAAQTAGHLSLDVQELNADLLACPGHKGLLGPLGTGLLYIRPGLELSMRSTRQGGTGTLSEDHFQPGQMPDKFESGNHNAPGLFGLSAAVEWLSTQPAESGRPHEIAITRQLLDGLKTIPQITVHGPVTAGERVGVVSLSIPGMEPHVIATLLDDMAQIEVRAGLHCAPSAHRSAGTFEHGGTVRLSAGRFTTPHEVSVAVETLRQIAEFSS
jgi:cysteine desulfurase/selenocysteine lyase